ncbi:helix-turn-helix domain-containing protein [Halocatena salina]|uniref:Helix-turn-helix domain-containing protein n=1 Tax=Halocatena salina TaxID=2934340 RepID=A0A8T9ZZX4_9EURY|nr:helix-turn-helix domain-containing protein [Halocatena salina]UPM42345.1 helix-turn-helix domain-containing protein [Halocatena salina]
MRTILRIAFRTRPTGIIEGVGETIDDVRSIELDNAFYVEDGTWIESLTIGSESQFDIEAVVERLSGVRLFHHRVVPTGPTAAGIERVTIIANESYPFILGLVLRQEAIPNRITYRDKEFRVVATVRDWEQFRSMADDIDHKLGKFELQQVTEIKNVGEPLDSGRLSETVVTKLTTEQIEILETAYNTGYFEVPRRADGTEVADRLGISQSNFSERLRTAENHLLELLFGTNAYHSEFTE